MPPENPKTKINNPKKAKFIAKWMVFGLAVIFSISIFIDISRAATGINKQINYQGKLTDGAGVSVADGNYNFKISLYTVSTGGTPVWTARGTVGTPTARSVAIANGIFSIMLGDTVAGDNALTLDFSQDAYYLGITVGSDAEMTSRKRIGSVPQAYNSNNLIGDGFVKITGVPTGSTVDAGTVYVNPASATSGYTLLGLAVAGTEKFKVSEAGNVSSAGTINSQTISSSANFTGTLAFATLGTTNTSNLLCRNSSNQLAACNTIGVTQGGTGTATQFTAGSVVFAGASGVYSQDNANFFWSSASARLGLGTATPAYLLDVSKSTNNYLARIYNTNTGSSAGGLSIRTDGTGNLLNLNANGTDVVTISEASSIFNNPTSFMAVGDVSMAYDLLMTNNSSSSVKSNGPLTVEVGEVFESNDLTLRTFNSGQVVLDSPGGLVSSQAQAWVLATGTSALNFVNAGAVSILNLDATNGRVGIGTTSPTAYLHLKAGTATANTAPLKFTSGTNLTTAEAGAMEWDGTSLYITQTTGPTRKTLAFTDSALTGTFDGINLATGNQGGIPYYSSTTQLTSTVAGTTGQALISGGTGSPTWFAPTAGSILFAGTGGILAQDNANFFWDDTNNRLGLGTTTPSYLLDINGTTRTKNLISENLIFSGSNTSILQAHTGHDGYTNFSGGIGTGGADSVLGAQRITREGNLVNIGSIQAGQMNLTKGGTFATKVDYTTGSGPASVALADVNGDGKSDMAVANWGSTSVSILLNNGNGTFATKVDYTTGSNPASVALADVNGDGKADMAVANYNSTSVSVLLNNGDGTFATKVDYTTGSNPNSVALADVNGDGKADMAVANFNSTSVSVFLNNGNGTFATKVDYTTGSNPASVALADVNGDGKSDMAVANWGSTSVSILLNNGNGTFATKVDYTTGTNPFSVALADVNGDGKADMAVAKYNSNSVSVLLNNGNGTFATKVDYTTGTNPFSVALADVNGDGKADMAVANYDSTSVSVLLNNGNGTFATKVDYTTGSYPHSVALADVNGDGKADMAVANFNSASVSVFLNQPQSMFFAQASTGYVGIGTTTPDSLLDILSSGAAATQLSITNTNAGDYDSQIGFQLADGTTNIFTAGVDDSDSDKFKISGGSVLGTNDRFVIDSSGNVGIGTATPTNLLSLSGQSAQTIWTERNTTTNTAGNNLTFRVGGATSGATDKNGGNLFLAGGTATGTGSSNLYFQTATANTTGTSDNAPSTKMTILGNGNVGIGTATPAYLLDITRSTDDYLASIYNSNTGSSAGGLFIRSNGTGNLLTLNSSGSDILTVSPVQASFNVPTAFTTSGDVSIAYDLILTNQTATSIKTNSSLVIEAGESFESNSLTLKTYNAGEVIVDGGSTAAYPLHVYRGTDGNVAGFTDTNGTCSVNPTSTALVCSSDATMKKDIISLSGIDALSAVKSLRLVNFHWNGETATDPLHTGVIAQEVAAVLPNLVSIGMDGKLAVNYLGLVPYALSAIQEQQLQITDFSTNLTNLNLKTDANITTLLGLQTSVDSNLVTINGKFETLDSQLATISNDNTILKYQLADEKIVTDQLQAQIDEIKLQNQRYDALNEIIAILDPSTLIFKDSLGNLDLLDGKLEASEIVAGVMTIKVVDLTRPTIGQALITKIAVDADGDGIDDTTGSDGKTVGVKTLAVDENSNIFITPEGDAGGRIWVEKQFDSSTELYTGFEIKCSNVQDKDIKVNWWIVKKREVISSP